MTVTNRTALQIGIMAGLLLGIALSAPAEGAADIRAEPVQMNAENRDARTVGGLTWRGGIAMTMDDPAFGGLSALQVSPDGHNILAVTDRGYWFRAELTYREGDLAGIRNAALEPILGPNGKPLDGKTLSDSESLAQLSPESHVVAFERQHRLWRYDGNPAQARPTAIAAPPAFSRLPENGGIEALTPLCNGSLLAIAERSRTAQRHVGAWLQTGTAWDDLTYPVSGGFRPTGATTLPGCDVLVVERSFSIVSGLGIRIMRIPSGAIRRGAALIPREIAQMTQTVTIDNFEGISARRNETGETLVYFVSDDNFSPLQRSLLVMYRLDDTGG